MSETADRAGWDPVWERIFSSREWGRYPPEHVVRFVARNFYRLPNRRAIRLLEMGCGPGANVWFLAREGFAVAGIDGSPTAIRLAIERLASEGLLADLRVGDYVELPWPDASFDGAVENVSLYCNPWSSVRLALGEIRRVLKPGAPFLSSFFTDRTWGYGLGKMVERDAFVDISEGPLAGHGFSLFLSRDRLNELFSEFDVVSVERIFQTMENERHLLEQFVVDCRKPQVSLTTDSAEDL